MKNKFKNVRVNKAIILTIIFFSVGIIIVGLISVAFAQNLKNVKIAEINNRFDDLEDHVINDINNKISLLQGFNAYIKLKNNFTEDEIYSYLDFLLNDSLEEIRNVTIIENTTIRWVYPLEGNETAIGVDLAQVKAQADVINYIKENRVAIFNGPVNLVQGGIGFIIRIPIIKDDQFWGMVSIVIKGEALDTILDDLASERELTILIYDYKNQDTLIYGDESLVSDKYLSYETEILNQKWLVKVLPTEDLKFSLFKDIILFMFIGTIFILLLSILFYRSLLNYYKMHESNKILGESASRDLLTGLYNRNILDTMFSQAHMTKWSNEHTISMILLDLDRFKVVNDTYGHDVGDLVLINTAETIKTIVRSSDVVVRWGGEEFVIILENISLAQSIAVAEKIRLSLEQLIHEKANVVTASFGVAQHVKNEYWDSWFKRVDEALYKAKTNGRNRVEVSDVKENMD